MRAYHVAPLLLGKGSTIQPGNWGRIKNNFAGDAAQAAREVILEQVRKEEFPALPSRLKSVFIIPNEVMAKIYRDQFCPTNIVYEVEILVDTTPRHTADMGLATAGFIGLDHYFSFARRYWGGELNSESLTEILLEGPIEVVANCDH